MTALEAAVRGVPKRIDKKQEEINIVVKSLLAVMMILWDYDKKEIQQHPSVPAHGRVRTPPLLLSTTTPLVPLTPATIPLQPRTIATANPRPPVPSRTTTNPYPPLPSSTTATINYLCLRFLSYFFVK
ncbi:unnamed protein product [Rotaria sordida]|uniref:Uncharacterized protein n=1 Tax=Rotaria sordida TaxID=392033 RepID=A0A816BQV9_9BILA|nr:unnamed protein product [Rotaria sordida]CAF1452718.1 unnamed protein product [Rotaria sordida]CAF1613677.1 unnamed protein product [Rotaria sordida]CAF4072605.1 unnamed protein product [Rotaria sordida]